MREYIKLFWEACTEGEPSFILYEVDADNHRLSLRSIDVFFKTVIPSILREFI